MAKRILNLNSLKDEQLLDLRMSDLKLSIPDSPLTSRIEQLNSELAARDSIFDRTAGSAMIGFRPTESLASRSPSTWPILG